MPVRLRRRRRVAAALERVSQSHIIGRVGAIDADRTLEAPRGLVVAPRRVQRVREVGELVSVLRRRGERLAIPIDRLVGSAERLESIRQIECGGCIARVVLERLPEAALRQLVVRELVGCVAQVEPGARVGRLQVHRRLKGANRIREARHLVERVAAVVMTVGVVGPLADHHVELLERLLAPLELQQHEAEVGPHLKAVRCWQAQLECRLVGRGGLLPSRGLMRH
eukprot:2750029-Prymnesium_polylepis.1